LVSILVGGTWRMAGFHFPEEMVECIVHTVDFAVFFFSSALT
jgi:hypothetical protein